MKLSPLRGHGRGSSGQPETARPRNRETVRVLGEVGVAQLVPGEVQPDDPVSGAANCSQSDCLDQALALQPQSGHENSGVDTGGGGGDGYGTFLGSVRGHQARSNPRDIPGYQTLLAYLPEQDLTLAVLCNEEAPSVDAALSELSLR